MYLFVLFALIVYFVSPHASYKVSFIMTPRQAILDALNGKIKRAELLEVLGIEGTEGNYCYKRKERIKKEVYIPTIEEVKDFFRSKGYSDYGADRAYTYYLIGGWEDSNGKKVRNWKQKMAANWFREEFKIKPTHTMYKKLEI